MSEIIPGYGVVVLNDRDEVLLVKHLEKAGHLTGTHGLPAGRALDNETDIQTAQRELHEETGLNVELDNLIRLPNIYVADIKRSDGSIKTMSIECFLATKVSGTVTPSADEETEATWVKIDSLDKLNLLPNVEQLVADAVAQKSML